MAKPKRKHRRPPSERKLLDVRERSAPLVLPESERREWRVYLIASDKSVQETVLVTAPDFDMAERTASAFARFNDGNCDRYLVERLVKCHEEGCDRVMAFYDPRPHEGESEAAPTVDTVMRGVKGCVRHPVPKELRDGSR